MNFRCNCQKRVLREKCVLMCLKFKHVIYKQQSSVDMDSDLYTLGTYCDLVHIYNTVENYNNIMNILLFKTCQQKCNNKVRTIYNINYLRNIKFIKRFSIFTTIIYQSYSHS